MNTQDMIRALRKRGCLAFQTVSEIPDELINSEVYRRSLSTLDWIETDTLIEVVENRGVDVYDPYGSEDDFVAGTIRDRLAQLYFRRIQGYDIIEDMNELILEASGRVI